jgi:hypothetical protein
LISTVDRQHGTHLGGAHAGLQIGQQWSVAGRQCGGLGNSATCAHGVKSRKDSRTFSNPAKMEAFTGFNILDKMLATGGYFERFRSRGIEKRKRDTPPDIWQ